MAIDSTRTDNKLPASHAIHILEGIRNLACRLTKQQSGAPEYRIKPGAHAGESVDLYISVQSHPNLSVNTKQARESGFVRRSYGIYRKNPEDPLFLRIMEWNPAIPDGTYKKLWEKPAAVMRARQEMGEHLAESIRQLALK